MSRVKRGVSASKRRKNVLKLTKGFKWRRKSHYRAAKEAVLKAGKYAHRDRRAKKRVMRRLWITRLNIALRGEGIKYSEFIRLQKKIGNKLDRKVLSELVVKEPVLFSSIVSQIKG
ncbi:MAG: 50S ribosomal protein L20 [Candidatus Moranbacteria bacterium]|jgi:large subunit ribosomal protein L20|nr:50S ribosomal protein L20 [Candidatus Moranbacteria bacterium]